MLVAMLLLLAVSDRHRMDVRPPCASSACPWVEDTHGYVSDAVIVLVVVHVLGVLAMCVLQRENLVAR